MINVFLFLSVVFIAISTSIGIFNIVNSHVTFKRYYPYRKFIMVLLLSSPWILLFFPFTLDWSTYITLVIVRIPLTIVWFLLMLLGLYFDIKRQKRK